MILEVIKENNNNIVKSKFKNNNKIKKYANNITFTEKN